MFIILHMGTKQENILVGIIIILIIAIGGVIFAISQQNPSDNSGTDVSVSATEGEILTFSGTLEDYDDGCIFDAQCVAYVGEYRIVTNPGLSVAGTTIGSSDINSDYIGRKVRVRAQVVSDDLLTIVGDESLYVLLDV